MWERLRLIAQLQERGLRIDAIRGLVKNIERGALDVAEWLGVERQLSASWAHDQARTVSEQELFELAASRRPGLIADLTRVKLIERRGEVYLVESPGLLAVAMKLEQAGIDQRTAADAAQVLRKHFGRAVSELTELLLERAHEGAIDIRQPTKLFSRCGPWPSRPCASSSRSRLSERCASCSTREPWQSSPRGGGRGGAERS